MSGTSGASGPADLISAAEASAIAPLTIMWNIVIASSGSIGFISPSSMAFRNIEIICARIRRIWSDESNASSELWRACVIIRQTSIFDRSN